MKSEMLKLRENGATYRDIAEIYGISYQRVAQICGKQNKKYFRPIKNKMCVYVGIRNWLNETKTSMAELTRLVYGNFHVEHFNSLRHYLKARNNPRKNIIDKILSITKLPYEYAFKLDEEICKNTENIVDK